ncbi:formyltransferase family protein [Yoonia sp. 208BN28-4]|uniref:formyltransferase family protein n=1 Tax=Yoonia sp. 208BN28-4 TaxID=3126505 RepID=UPI00309A8320
MTTDLNDVIMLATDTTRSRAYIQNMVRRGLRPAAVIALASAKSNLPGQSKTVLPTTPAHADDDTLWQAGHFDPNTALADDLAALGAPVEMLDTTNINDPEVVAAIAARSESVMIYAGYGGQILRQDVLDTGVDFLHVHGGWVPSFKGSTTNYFAMIAQDRIGASAIFLTADLDGGPVIKRATFPTPPDRTMLDHLHDSAARAVVLCDVLESYAATSAWPSENPSEDEKDETYFVIHPVLKHIAVYGSGDD